jgi:predicted nucleotidyltransferase component of viral defense system
MKKLFDFLKKRMDIENNRFLEKDIIIHRLLFRLMKTYFKEDYAFKGGTCLTKCHLGYYRFSEDLDFTYIHQNEFKDVSQKQLRKLISKKIDTVSSLLVVIAKDLDIDFKHDKSNSRYVMFGASNKFVTFKLWYNSVNGLKEEFVKVQINYYDVIINDFIVTKANSLFLSIPREDIELVQPEYVDLIEDIELCAYSLEEIFLEKIRAILTRRGTKSRDYIDVYFIKNNMKIDFDKEESNIIKKVKFILVYDKYLQNFSVIKPENLILGEEEKLLLKPLDKGFKKFLPEFFEYLKNLEDKILNK